MAGTCYSLEPLRTNGGGLTLVDGIKAARLTEVVVERDSTECCRAQFQGHDLTRMVAGCGDLPCPAGEIVRACFAMNYTTGGRARNSEVRLPNVADHDRDRDGIVNQDFLRANGFVVAHDDADGLVDAA